MTRTAADLGMGLAPVRAARAIRAGERIHVVGIAGAGASAAALLASAAGAEVSGCDSGGPSPYTPAVEAAGIKINWLHEARHVTGAPHPDRLAVTKALTAIAPDHPELLAARAHRVPAEPWQQVVADAAHGRTLVAVAGTHGKSTTSAWLAWLLAEGGLDPSAFVGALLPAALTGGPPATARVGRGPQFVVEADEYAGNFDAYRPDVVVLTTIEWDHPDVFADREAVTAAFATWIGAVPDATLIVNLQDPGVVELLGQLEASQSRSGSIIGVSLGDVEAHRIAESEPAALWIDGRFSADIIERTANGMVLDIDGLAGSRRRLHLPVMGSHNVSNGMLALACAATLDPRRGEESADRLLWALASFPGIGRRLERKGEARGVVVYDDYGHHPTAIRATIAALRQREPDRRVWAVYEPLTFHRTAAMLDEFADALALGDAVVIADIWASRDPDTTVTSAAALATAVRKRRKDVVAEAPGSVEETAAWLARNVERGDAVLVMGGGRSYRIAELLLGALASS